LSAQHGPAFRHARITGYGSFAAKAQRIAIIQRFLDHSGFHDAARQHVQGDASSRSYERLTFDGANYILMNAPKRPDGPPVHDGKPYSIIAHLAEDVTPFIAMARALLERGFSAPRIIAADRESGLLVLEDLGNELVVSGTPPVPIKARYEAATDLLAALHRQTLPQVLPVEPGVEYKLPHYDMDALLIEVELLPDWYLAKVGTPLSNHAMANYLKLWHEALLPVIAAPQTWVLRDFHSPNLLWLPQRESIAHIGLLDFQDAVMGSAAYDLASLLHDARVDVPETMEIALLSRYTRTRLQADPSFDVPAFVRLFATLAAQRASKILGIFARLDRRDGKPQYLRHLPRVWDYLKRSLAHPALADLAAWYRLNVPPPKI
jgi:N-acetylmuramate 1-kinase